MQIRLPSSTQDKTGNIPTPLATGASERTSAFTILEVIIACAIFFMVVFALLEVVVQGLSAARSLQQREPDAGMLAAILSMTNKLEETTEEGDFENLAPGLYPGYRWARSVEQVGSNGLFQVDYIVYYAKSHGKRGLSEAHMSMLLFKPDSPPGARFSGR
ncbi:MAG TPA: hypothetical protein VGE41_00985 [Verrucomicrobiae bacterium]